MNRLDRLFNPQSIAVVGASADETKAGYHMLYAVKKFPGPVYPINPKATDLLGLKAYAGLEAVGRPVDLVALCIPARGCLEAIREAAARGVGAVMIAGGGFGETGAEGRSLQDEILAACREGGVRLLGPNTAGFVNPRAGLTMNFWPYADHFRPGCVGIVSQSGAMNLVLGSAVHRAGLGVSLGVGLGNAPDVGVPEVLEYLTEDEATRAIAVYLEGVSDGRRLFEALERTTRKKPVAVLAVGRADIGEFAASHTGKLIGSYALKRAALTQAGAVVVESSQDLVDAVRAFSKVRLDPDPDPGVGFLTGQAGPAMIITDYLRARSVRIPELDASTVDRISQVLPVMTYIRNPVDTGRPIHSLFTRVLSIMAEDPNLDLLLTFAIHEPMCVEPVPLYQAIRGRTDKPLIFGTAGLPEDLAPTLRDLDKMDVPAFPGPERAAVAVWSLVQDAKAAYRKSRTENPPAPIAAARPLAPGLNEAEAKTLLADLGLPTPARAVCRDRREAAGAFARMKKPLVAKILSAAVAHKTEVGGVITGIETEAALDAALDRIDAIEAPGEKACLLEETAPAGLEIIVGAKNDDSFGAVVMLGLGGTAAEALGDVSMRLAPLTVPEAMGMIGELKTGALFDGWRGGPRYDKNQVAETLVRIGRFMLEHPEIREMDLNPVRVYEKGLLILDALIVV